MEFLQSRILLFELINSPINIEWKNILIVYNSAILKMRVTTSLRGHDTLRGHDPLGGHVNSNNIKCKNICILLNCYILILQWKVKLNFHNRNTENRVAQYLLSQDNKFEKPSCIIYISCLLHLTLLYLTFITSPPSCIVHYSIQCLFHHSLFYLTFISSFTILFNVYFIIHYSIQRLFHHSLFYLTFISSFTILFNIYFIIHYSI